MDILTKIQIATENDVILWDNGGVGYIDGECVLKINKLPDKDEYSVQTIDKADGYTRIGTLVGFYAYYVANIERQATAKRQKAVAELDRLLG